MRRVGDFGRPAVVLVGVALLAASPARADCVDVVKQLMGAFGQIKDDRLKFLVGLDIDRAFRELGEGDEMECLQVTDHAVRLLKTMQ